VHTCLSLLDQGSPLSRANAQICLLAVATSLIMEDMKHRVMGTSMTTVPALLPVAFKKIVTNGAWVPFASTSSRSPAQKMTVTPATKPMVPLNKNEITSAQGTVYDASFTFSATQDVSLGVLVPMGCSAYSCVLHCRSQAVSCMLSTHLRRWMLPVMTILRHC